MNFTFGPLSEAKTIHHMPMNFMLESSSKPRVRPEPLPSWESKSQVYEETVVVLEKHKDIAHSVYTTREKYVIVVLGGVLGLWLSISSPIYLPVLPTLQEYFQVLEEKLHITVVVYSIFQGLAPILFSNLSDKLGRRVIIIACLVMYIAANIGLALNTLFSGLILLRCLQAFGILSTLSVASGIASDITTKAERASFIGLSTGLSLLGQAFGALIGGVISSAFGWQGIFWFLAIAAGATLAVDWCLLPETARNLVGNGLSLPPHHQWITVAPVLSLPHLASRRTPNFAPNATVAPPKPFNMLLPFTILRNMPVCLTLIPASIAYSLWLMMLTTLSTSLSKKYSYSTLQIALAYIPSGIGGLAGSVTIGEILDWSYRRTYAQYQKDVTRFRDSSHYKINNNMPKFNIFRARLTLASLPTSLCVVGSLLLGWVLQYLGPVELVLAASFIISFGAMNFLTISTTVMVDLFPSQLSGLSSCVNLTRCWAAALFIAVLSHMEHSMTVAGCYLLMAGLCAISSLCLVYLVKCSSGWI